jgi:hypothetical protein
VTLGCHRPARPLACVADWRGQPARGTLATACAARPARPRRARSSGPWHGSRPWRGPPAQHGGSRSACSASTRRDSSPTCQRGDARPAIPGRLARLVRSVAPTWRDPQHGGQGTVSSARGVAVRALRGLAAGQCGTRIPARLGHGGAAPVP